MKNIFFIIIDALRFDSLNDDVSKKIAPNLKKLCDEGILQKVTTNGQTTKFALPSIFTQTFPLDYGGYNYGIKNKPRSFVELINKKNFFCRMFEGHDVDGPFGCMERGFNYNGCYYDKRILLEGFIKKKLLYDVKKWQLGEISKTEILKTIQKEILVILNFMKKQERVKHSFFEDKIGPYSEREKKLLDKEIALLTDFPELILEKIIKINPYFYYDYIGKKPSNLTFLKFKIKNKLFSYKKKLQTTFNRIFSTEIHFVPSRPKVSLSCKKMFLDALKNYERHNLKIFTYIHFMDLHDHHVFYQFFEDFFSKVRLIPRVFIARSKNKTNNPRKFTYDLALCNIDYQFSIFLKKLEKMKKMKDSIFFITGDHGEGWDKMRLKELKKDFGFRTYSELLTIPFVISPFKSKQLKNSNLFDSMSISATILDILDIKQHSSFKGKSIFSKGNKIIITESCGRGNADIEKKDIFFTLTASKYKLFCKIEGKVMLLKRLYSLESDARELKNIINSAPSKVLNDFLSHLYSKRKEILTIRGFRKIPRLDHSNVKVKADHLVN